MKDNEVLLKRAIEHIKSGNYKRAAEYFYGIISNDKKDDNAWVLLGFCQIKMDDFENAYISFNNALKINNKHSFAWSGKAFLLFLANEYDKSLMYCDFALECDSENKHALNIKRNIEKTGFDDGFVANSNIRFNVDNILNSFNNQKVSDDNYLIEEDDEYMTVKLNKMDLNKIDGYRTISDLNKFEKIFSEKRISMLKNNPLTVDAYDKILLKIKEVGKDNFKDIIKENDIDLSKINIFKKISLLTLSYTDIEYKTKGAELGSFAFNVIRIDDRLDESNQISTLIHELSHFLLNEIFTQSLMYIWNSDKTNAIEAVSVYCMSNSKSYKLMNEYCAHTVQGRFLPFGYQNYGSFNMLLEKFDSEKDKKKVKYYLTLGNSFAEDIISVLEEFIPKNWRDEIKDQFKKDFNQPPNYNGIIFETKKTVSREHCVKNINKILTKGVFSSVINDDIDVLRKFKKKYEK